jgi:hypothetical protein
LTASNVDVINNLRLEYLTIKNDMTSSDISEASMSVLYGRIDAIRAQLTKMGAGAR